MAKAEENENRKLVNSIIKGIEEKKGHGITCIHLGQLENAVTDYFIICHGTSNTQVDAIADSVVETVRKEQKEKPWQKEGFENAEWILIDYVKAVVHIFQQHTRDFYKLEELWGDAEIEYYGDET
jgi:ribosome-associated protein